MNHLVALLTRRAQQQAQQEALKIWQHGSWQSITWTQFQQSWQKVAQALIHLGHKSGERVAIMSNNLPQWTISDLGILAARGCVVPIYPTNTAEQSQYILQDSGCSILFVGHREQLELALELQQNGVIEHLICLNPDLQLTEQEAKSVIAWQELLEMNSSIASTELANRQLQFDSSELATLIYTSGTTGEPKGVMLDHDNFAAAFRMHDERLSVDETDTSLSFLPLSHVFERAWTYYILYRGACNVYLEDPSEVQAALERTKPTLMCSVPRLYEKIHGAILQKVAAAPKTKQMLFNWALKTAEMRFLAMNKHQSVSFALEKKYQLADRLVLRKLRSIFVNAKILPCSGARLADDINLFFQSIGVPLNYGYGMTETTATVSCYPEGKIRIGSIGAPMNDIEVKLNDEGEILVKGDTVMRGYFNKPEATEQCIIDGWLHTGDAGEFDTAGNLVMTERIKELMKTSGGKYIAPQRVEGELIREPLFEQVAIIAEARHFVSALIVPAYEALELHAHQLGLKFKDRAELLEHAEIKSLMQSRLKQVQSNLARFEQVKQFTLLPREFCMKQGELTPTLKLRRKVIEGRFAEQIKAMYAIKPATI
ncbi:long-chain fatty acid--CoA ligase [Alginatibacterium sediminis]|uniref:Long-chain fatty acid--CoA ligase n=1 Tax=Alginatibacterium sediminis TaxID=2164068 RepID=A0A420EDQ7_9ALTE|nr:long-chain fatty acid--CoA ligase [Alginatibacterium sediminis]RKF18815.1 long-chain fatty acid--CoA ligase [Alginatibacterium sediminis]